VAISAASQAAGVIQRESTPTLGGVVNGVTVTMKFHYTRVGTVALVTILGGSVTVNFFYPDIGQQSITENITEGEAPAVFDVNPLDVASACTAGSGKLHFDLIGDATLTSA
jgi:hypothetical protein